jgi:hypothetical protein
MDVKTAPRSSTPGTTSRRPLRSQSQGFSPHNRDAGTPQSLRRVQGEFVTRHTTDTPRSIRATGTRHRRLHVRHRCRAAVIRPKRLAAPRFLFQETQPGPTKIQCIRPRAAGQHFRHFRIFTDHKPITHSNRNGTNVHRGNLVISTSQHNSLPTYDTSLDMTALSPTLSRVESLTAPPSYDALAA